MTDIIPFPSTTIRQHQDDKYWDVVHQNMSLWLKLKLLDAATRNFAEQIHEYANRSGDAYLSQASQEFLRNWNRLHEAERSHDHG